MVGIHEMLPVKQPQVSVGERDYAGAYAGGRTDGTKNTATRVRRLFSFAQIFFFALSYMSSWEAIATNVGLIFWNGGPRSLIWGFFIVLPGVLCQVASMAEMASVQPIAGAQYHWTHYLAPPSSRKFITWVQGWITWFSWISLLAGVVNIAANIIVTLAAAQFTDWVPQGWHTVLIMYAMLIIMAILNMYMFWLIPWVEMVNGLLHIILWIVFVSVLVTLAPRHSAEWVFTEKSNLSGWNNDFVSFNLGILLVTWGFVGFDGAVHMSEEVRKARHAVPRAMFWSILMNGILAFAMTLVFLFCMGPVEDVMASTYPLLAICMSATGSLVGSSAMVGGILITVVGVSLGSVASASRLTWAWSRDGALPGYFSYIDPKHRVPIRSVWLPVFIVMLLSLLNLASYTAFSVIIALSTFGLYQSYFIAISCMLYARFTDRIEDGGWSLGWWGYPINMFALFYSAWVGVFFVFPNYLPIDASTMNYALPINAAVWLFAIVSYFFWAKQNWRGLNKDVVDAVVADSIRNTKD